MPSARDRLRFERLAKRMDALEAQEGMRAPRSLAESLAATPDPRDMPFADLDAWHAEQLRDHLWEKRRWREAERNRRDRLRASADAKRRDAGLESAESDPDEPPPKSGLPDPQ